MGDETSGSWALYRARRVFAVVALAAIATGVASSTSTARAASHGDPQSPATTDYGTRSASPGDFDAARARAERDGSARLIVGLQTTFTPEGALSGSSRREQRRSIADETRRVEDSLRGSGFSVIHRYTTVPYVALRLSPDAIERLERSGRAASLDEDKPDLLALDSSGPLVEATESATVGRTGKGWHIAILDTGVQASHLFLRQGNGTSKVVAEACYSADAECPGGVFESTSTGSGEPCPWSNCHHGTHVAGITAGRGTARSGVARDARLVSIRIFSSVSGCGTCSYTSDQIKGLDRVSVLGDSLSIASANMSLSGNVTSSNCDSDPRKPSIDTLRSKGIATVIASGNNGSKTGVGFPSCISTAITVGSSNDSDVVSSFSNSSSLVELLAPGESITSSVPDDIHPKDGIATASGTSMAAPHVAGAFAVLRSIAPTATVSSLLDALQATGRPDTDPENGVTKPRIRVLAAGAALADTGLRLVDEYSGGSLDVASGGAGFRASSTGTITLASIPAGATLVATHIVWTTIGGPDPSITLEGAPVTGTLVGTSADTGWNIDHLEPNRTYHAVVSPPLGNGTYTIGGVGDVGAALGQGASVVTTYSKAGGAIGHVYQRFGASTTCGGRTASTTLSATGSGSYAVAPYLLVDIGDGQTLSEKPLKVATTAITGADAFAGAAGPYWDDARVSVPPELLPVGAKAQLTLKGIGDCLVLSHVALVYASTS